jgi:hypothetical protein
MKKTVIVTTFGCFVLAAYVLGQNQTKEKRIEPCCCKHTQQIAEDLHWIRESMSKPFVPPKLNHSEHGKEPKDTGKLKPPQFNFKLEK